MANQIALPVHPTAFLRAAGPAATGIGGASAANAPFDAGPEGMRDQNIICFAKDWDEDPTSNNHVMKLLARNNRVLWLNSISMRTPNFRDGRDITKIFRKLRSFAKGPRRVEENLWVYTPIVLPFPHSRVSVAVNRLILRASLRLLRRRFGMSDFQLWTFLPNAVEYVGRLGESCVVYYCIDEWSKFTYLDGPRMALMEEALCRKADVVFATAKSLEERRRPFNPETHLASHGVDYDHFAAALDEKTPVAPELASLSGPILGFFGLIHEWIDLKLVEFLASRHPEWTIALIGKSSVDTSGLNKYANVHLLGRKPYSDLPKYCKAFSVGLIPFEVNELTRNVNPIKLREYLSAGLPVVSTALPEVVYYSDSCSVARDYEEFEQGVMQAIRTDSPEERRRRSRSMRSETWERKVAELGECVMRVRRSKDVKRGEPR